MKAKKTEELVRLTEEKINESIREFTKRRKRMFNIVRWFKYPLVVLTVLLTITLGLNLDGYSEVLGLNPATAQKNIGLIIGAIITGLTTLMTFWNVEEYWIKNKVIELQLKSLLNKLQFNKTVGTTKSKINELFKSYQTIIGQQEEIWKSTLDDRNNDSDGK